MSCVEGTTRNQPCDMPPDPPAAFFAPVFPESCTYVYPSSPMIARQPSSMPASDRSTQTSSLVPIIQSHTTHKGSLSHMVSHKYHKSMSARKLCALDPPIVVPACTLPEQSTYDGLPTLQSREFLPYCKRHITLDCKISDVPRHRHI